MVDPNRSYWQNHLTDIASPLTCIDASIAGGSRQSPCNQNRDMEAGVVLRH
jgi:hypothetical protein